MLFKYEAITNTGEKKIGTIDAANKDLAIVAIQHRGLVVSSLKEDGEKSGLLNMSFFGKGIPMKDVVMMSRQISTLFEAQVSALKAFNLIATSTQNKNLAKVLEGVGEDLQSGSSISASLSRHPEAFSDFYVSMVKSGEESGKLNQVFSYLADYLDRQYQLTSKTRNALIYPAFVVGVFVLVMILMFLFIIPRLTDIIKESGQVLPLSTKIIMGISDLFVHYWMVLLLIIAVFSIYIIKMTRSESGKQSLDRIKLRIPVFKNIFLKLYLSRIADNMNTMLSSGISIVRVLELTSGVVGNLTFETMLKDISESVKGGSSIADAFGKYPEIPQIMTGMIRVGEETGSLGNILNTLGHFYAREVNDAIDTLVGLIEPFMIVFLGLGVGILLTSILMPIYNIAGGI